LSVGETSSAVAMASLTTGDGRRPRVAIVGGTPSSAMVATVLCDQFGCVPLTTRTGEAVLGLLRRDVPLDLVIMDLVVPDMDGFVAVELIRTLRERGKLPIVALASDRTEMMAPRARGAGFAGSVVKPYSPRELYFAMQAALTLTAPRDVVGHA
jgi:two-component system chemotaxis sensor kinase CheA